MIEGSGSESTAGSGSIPVKSGYGSGSGRPKNTWIRIRIRIRNTAANPPTRTANPPTRNGGRLGGRGDPAGGPAVALRQLTGGGRGAAVVISLCLQDQLGDLLGALVRHLPGQQLRLRKLVPIPDHQQQPEALCWMRKCWVYFCV